MPTNVQATVYSAFWAAIQSGIDAYNAVAPGLNLPPVTGGSRLDDRADGRTQSRTPGKLPAGFPRVRLQIIGGSQQKTPTPTFALAAGIAGTDVVIPHTVVLLETITHDKQQDGQQTPLESYIDAGLLSGYPKYGIAYCASVTTTIRRADKFVDGEKRTVREKTTVVTLRPHRSDLV